MSEVELSNQIEQAKKTVCNLVAKLDGLAKTYTDAAKAHLPGFFQTQVGYGIDRHPDVVIKLGDGGVRNVQEEIDRFMADIPRLVDQALSNPQNWFHHRRIPNDRFTDDNPVRSKPNSLSDFEQLLVPVLRPFGEIMVRRKLADASDWRESHGGELPSYQLHALPDSISKIGKAYVEGFNALIEANSSLKRLEHQKSQQDAKNLWDRAKH